MPQRFLQRLTTSLKPQPYLRSQSRSFSAFPVRNLDHRPAFAQQSKPDKPGLAKPKLSTTDILKHSSTPPQPTSSPSTQAPTNKNNPLTPQNGPHLTQLLSSFEDPLVGLSPPLAPGPSTPNDAPPPSAEVPTLKVNRPIGSTKKAATQTQTELPKILAPHAFNTHRFVRQLEDSSFKLPVARTVMRVVQKSLEASEHRWLLSGPGGGVISRGYAEGQAYLYDAALGELRTEVKVKTRNDGIVLKSASNALQREIDALKQKMKEDVDALKNEIQLEMNGRKEEASDDQKKVELAIQELNSKFTILVGDVRTEIETRKWVTTRRCIVAIASLALCVIIFTALESNQIGGGSSSSSSAQTQLQREVLKTVEELGITPARDQSDSIFSGTLFGQGKRVGEEDSHNENTT